MHVVFGLAYWEFDWSVNTSTWPLDHVCNEASQEQKTSHMTVAGTYIVDQLASLSAQTESGEGVTGAHYQTLLFENGPY